MGERTPFPPSYTFDHVFGAETTTKEVYEKGAKDVALSALSGKNATIFAYGQTCSGKTYTMHGITENAADDIFDHIKQHDDRTFLLKFSALEIYNEVASDLLNPESGPLRLLDDPERGTVIERLVEEVVRDKDHLCKLLAICEAHRRVGETSLNDISSRSHQIIRLTVESSPRMMAEESPVKSLIAVLNFVDLAGSERASLTQSEGTRLKEGCHINRSLLTLSTVIRKLSDANRAKGGHVPYRDSKLTRILQNSLGGNARTAIICTLSSSNRHVEQSRNTLFFATCAKEVINIAQVNVVISDKALIKQLKKEIALLEAKLRLSSDYMSPRSSQDALLLEKDLQIQVMQVEMRKALQQRDNAQSQLKDALQQMEATQQSKAIALCQIDSETRSTTPLSNASENQFFQRESSDRIFEVERDTGWKQDCVVEVKYIDESLQQPLEKIDTQGSERQVSSASAVLLQEIYKLEHLQNELAQDANRALEAVQKEVECLRLAQTGMNQEAAEIVAKLQAEIHEIYESGVSEASLKQYPVTKDLIVEENRRSVSLKDEIQRTVSKNKEKFCDPDDMTDLEKMLVNMQISVEGLVLPTSSIQPGETPWNEAGSMNSRPDSAEGSPHKTNFVIDENTPPQAEENIRSVHAYVTDLKERIAKLQYQKQLLVDRVVELQRNGHIEEEFDSMSHPTSPARWKSDFHMKQKQIFELWDACHVSIVHRSQFYMLFRGDPADAIYVEVELRRLTWLRNQHAAVSGLKSVGQEDQVASLAASMRALKREREALVKYLRTRLSEMEREEIYRQWGIALEMKQRKVKVAMMVWTDCADDQHIRRSAELVARLVGFWNNNSKEMFQLRFSPPDHNMHHHSHKPTRLFGWNSISSLLSF